MAFIKLQFRPGVNRDQTDYSNEGGWYECDKIRFRSGYPQKIGGWTKIDVPFSGVCRQMWNWITTYSDNLLAMGTNTKLYIESAGNYYDITPFETALAGSNTFAVTITSTTVTVTTTTALPSWVVDGEPVKISGFAAPLGGIPEVELNGVQIVNVTGANSFTFEVTTAATSTTSVSGAGYDVQAEIEPGNPILIGGLGWGVGVWGGSVTIDTPTPRAWNVGATDGPLNLPQRDWWLDNFDNDLVANIRNGPIYWWKRGTTNDPSSALATHAITLKEYAVEEGFDPDAVPTIVTQVLVSQQDKHLIAFGAVPFGFTSAADFDPLLIRWADQNTPTDWTPSIDQTTSAGFLRLSRGSRIVCALPSRQEILVWTDSNLYTLQPSYSLSVFNLQEYADNISIMSPRAMASAANITYWMGQDKFYAYTGRVETLPCTLRNHVFTNFNYDQSEQVICGTNEQWNEVWWFYPTAQSNYNDAYIVYNHLERIWYYGTIDRTAWLDTPLRRYPQAANTPISVSENVVTVGDGYLYNHEDGLNDDTSEMISYIRSSDFDIGDGDQFMLTRRIIPDLDFAGSTVSNPEATLEIRYRNFPGSALQTQTEDNARVTQTTLGQYTAQVFLRARARQMAIKIMSEGLGVQWQLGAPRLDAREDGKR